MSDKKNISGSQASDDEIPALNIPTATIHKIRDCESDRFDLLAKAAGLDLARDFRFLDLTRADLTGINWAEFNFEGSRFTDIAGVTPEMVVVPAGEFLMGSPKNEGGRSSNEGPQHKVTISRPFAVGRYPIIFDEWDKALDLSFGGPKLKDSFGRGRQPVVNVSWEEAKSYADWLTSYSGKPYRLLTEAEWEYACRAGSTALFSFGDDEDELDQYAWHFDNAGSKPHPVGEKRPNAFGLYDMHGNVWEWVNDWYGPYESEPLTDPQGPKSGRLRVHRGGSWHLYAWLLRSAVRHYYTPGIHSDNLGFRLARTLQ